MSFWKERKHSYAIKLLTSGSLHATYGKTCLYSTKKRAKAEIQYLHLYRGEAEVVKVLVKYEEVKQGDME